MSLAPLRPKGPPLNAMRAFEAAARLESFVAAAEELSVTPGAVSQQIKSLEGWAGCALFQRNAQGVDLTAAGRALLPDFVAAFDALGVATHALRNQRPAIEIHIAALPSVAQLWLPSRLGRVRQQMPDIKISVTAMETPPNLARELFDLSLFYQTPGDDPAQITLADDRISPVCSPLLAQRLDGPESLNTLPLLQDQTWADDWTIWSAATGVHLSDPASGPGYSLYSLALEEAASGAGALMGHAALVSDALRDGRLVQPFDLQHETGRALVLSLAQSPVRNPEMHQLVHILTG